MIAILVSLFLNLSEVCVKMLNPCCLISSVLQRKVQNV
jgi:hypothetical protein